MVFGDTSGRPASQLRQELYKRPGRPPGHPPPQVCVDPPRSTGDSVSVEVNPVALRRHELFQNGRCFAGAALLSGPDIQDI